MVFQAIEISQIDIRTMHCNVLCLRSFPGIHLFWSSEAFLMNVSDQGDLRNGYSSNFPDDRCRQEWKHFQNCEKGPAIVLIIIIISDADEMIMR